MATPAGEAAAACAVTGAWACGMIAHIDSISNIFARYPAAGFIMLSLIGAAVGWCLLLERGHFDGVEAKPKLRTMVSRLIIGAGVGVAAALLYEAFGAAQRGLWMLTSALIAMFPLEAASGKLPEMIGAWREALRKK